MDCSVYEQLPDCAVCDDKIEGEIRKFKLPGSDVVEERHPACCPQIVYVNAYRVTLGYSGPQEGGTWHDEGEALGSIPIDIKTDPSAFIEHYKLLYKDVQVRTKSSMGGSDLRIVVEEHLAEYYSTYRPYE